MPKLEGPWFYDADTKNLATDYRRLVGKAALALVYVVATEAGKAEGHLVLNDPSGGNNVVRDLARVTWAPMGADGKPGEFTGADCPKQKLGPVTNVEFEGQGVLGVWLELSKAAEQPLQVQLGTGKVDKMPTVTKPVTPIVMPPTTTPADAPAPTRSRRGMLPMG